MEEESLGCKMEALLVVEGIKRKIEGWRRWRAGVIGKKRSGC